MEKSERQNGYYKHYRQQKRKAAKKIPHHTAATPLILKTQSKNRAKDVIQTKPIVLILIRIIQEVNAKRIYKKIIHSSGQNYLPNSTSIQGAPCLF